MSEDYGDLSEDELIGQIQHQLESHPEIDGSDLEFKFEDDQLVVSGGLQNEEQMEALVHILEDFLDPKDYVFEVELAETSDRTEDFEESLRTGATEEEEDEEDVDELEEYDEDEMEEEDDEFEEEEEEFDDEKW